MDDIWRRRPDLEKLTERVWELRDPHNAQIRRHLVRVNQETGEVVIEHG